jgi:hypothetical protein
MSKSKKAAHLKKGVKPKTYTIYGIFDFQKNRLLKISLIQEDLELEYDLEGYDSDRYDIVSFQIKVT